MAEQPICTTCSKLLSSAGERHTFEDCIRYYVQTHPDDLTVILDGRAVPLKRVADALGSKERGDG